MPADVLTREEVMLPASVILATLSGGECSCLPSRSWGVDFFFLNIVESVECGVVLFFFFQLRDQSYVLSRLKPSFQNQSEFMECGAF